MGILNIDESTKKDARIIMADALLDRQEEGSRKRRAHRKSRLGKQDGHNITHCLVLTRGPGCANCKLRSIKVSLQ